MKSYILRPHYLAKISPFINQALIKVIVGQRRVGKSYLLLQLIDHIRQQYTDANIIYINKELYEFDSIKDYHDLIRYISVKTQADNPNYVFIDEIQDIREFEKAIRSLQSIGNYDIYITGSNANLLSGELATLLSGRYIEFTVYSLSYPEFLKFHKFDNTNDTLMKYIKFGGLPYLIHLELTEDIIYDYLQSIYNSILLKDIVARYQVRNVNFLENLVRFLADNIGNLTTAKRISDFLKNQKINMSPNIILNYLSNLISSNIILKASRLNIEGRKIFEISEKYYFEDLGLRHALVGYRQSAINQVYENLVYNHLIVNGYKVYIGQLPNREIDFVAEKGNDRLYIQTAYLIPNKQVWEREFGNLLTIKDNFPKFVVSNDESAGGSEKGIEHLHIRDFLTRTW
ncbi:MAG: ATP-binding protein [Candidatus Marinimicrobia bacterium]|nr:ATP-binding protein [bacterium]MCG2715975.1 ATP-binding protein [Candidatus Neomarinimicrobiota bacterium]